MTRISAFLVLALAALLAAPAARAADTPCLQNNRIYDWQPVAGNRAIVVTDIMRQKFRVSFTGICNNLQFHIGLGFAPFDRSGLACLSRGDSVLVRRSPGLPGDRCIVASVEPAAMTRQRGNLRAR